ncbi:hypothetical protein VYU27_004048 [Nannochloropsis oceanica]
MSAQDEERRKALKPAVNMASAVAIAKKVWGLRIDDDDDDPPKLLESYDDCNFYISGTLPPSALDPSPTKQKYLLKVQNGVESATPQVLAFQHAMMSRLTSAGLQCQRPVLLPPSLPPSSDNVEPHFIHYQTLPVLAGPPTRLAIRLLQWVEGTSLVNISPPAFSSSSAPNLPPSPPPLALALLSAGRYLGKIDQALLNFNHPGAHRQHMWDVRSLSQLRAWVPYVPEEGEKRRLVLSVIEAFEKEVVPVAEKGEQETAQEEENRRTEEEKTAGFRQGVVMGDWNDANIIVDPLRPSLVLGAIDFGDSLWSWRINDVAIAMAYAAVSSFGKTHPVHAAALLLHGFVATASSIPPWEAGHLLTLACGRLAISVTLGAYSFAQNPENEYLLIHAQPAWSALRTLWGRQRERVVEVFRRAAEGGREGGEGDEEFWKEIAGKRFGLVGEEDWVGLCREGEGDKGNE